MINPGYTEKLMRREVRNSVTSLGSYEKLESEVQPRSAASPRRESLRQSSRTHSMSPVPFSLLVSGKLSLKKFNSIYAKIVVQLETLKNLSETKKYEAESLADLSRQLQRADEFSIRFSRNNIYETRRIVADLKRLIAQYPMESFPVAECKLLCKRIILAYQSASQALQTYINYVKNPSNLETSDKINELVMIIADLFLCCDHLSLMPYEMQVKNEGARLCNELMAILSKKVTPLDELEMKEMEVKKRAKPPIEEPPKNTLSMYMTKLTSRSKTDIPKKQKPPCLFGKKPRRMKKKYEKAARITHEIYTQKMNSQKPLGSKIVKFEPPAENESELLRRGIRKPKTTPRAVKSQDDDVETMIQILGDDEVPTARRDLTPCEEDSTRSNKSNIRQLILEAIDELQNLDKKEQKSSLEKLLISIQNRPRNPNVKVYNVKSKDFDVEPKEEEKEEEKKEEKKEEKPKTDLITLFENQKVLEEVLSKERRLKMIFKPINGKKTDESEGELSPRGKIKLRIPEDMIINLNKQRKAFYEFRNNNIMYKKTLAKKPWDLIARIADRVLLDLVKDLAMDFQNDALLRRLYLNELLEVIN